MSCDLGIINDEKIIWIIINIKENLNIKFINSILVTPKFQSIISSLLLSNFDVMWNMLKNNTKGNNLLNILGKLSNE
tara:strand:+ start:1053 stop:1283 length:231 start_codon:yes stop_codon:yes gene_type:complete